MAGASISFRQVSKRYGKVSALEEFDLDIKPGEFMTFLGPSGSGKTTALNVLAGFTGATTGDILIDDRSIIALPPERRNVGMVFQNYALFPHLNVFENVAFPLRLRGIKGAQLRLRVDAALALVQLHDFGGRLPKELSGGQRQRVAFARAIVFEPPVLLMDEPLGALDLKLRQAMQLEIKQYHAQLGCTIVFVTHDQGEALALSDRIAVMGKGRIEQVDAADVIYDRPNSLYVAEFIGRTNVLTVEAGPSGPQISGTDIALPAKLAGGRPGQGSVVLSLRPEKIIRAATARDGSVVMDAQISEVLFQGDLVHYRAKLPGGLKLQFQEHRSPGSDILKVGGSVRLAFDPEDALRL